jgi:hypothetical protein
METYFEPLPTVCKAAGMSSYPNEKPVKAEDKRVKDPRPKLTKALIQQKCCSNATQSDSVLLQK